MIKIGAYKELPITAIANGILYRAMVSLPTFMTDSDRPLQERVVFFESDSMTGCGVYLESLLARAWCIDTANWCEREFIYNVFSVDDLRRNSLCSGPSNDIQLFEIGAGVMGIGPNKIHYARAHDVDLFVSPRVARRLRDALDTIDVLYTNEAKSSR